MPVIQSVTLDDRVVDLITFCGEVLEEKKWSTTQVAGGGGGMNAGTGLPNPVNITSVSTTHDQFFLRSDSGEEKSFQLAGGGIALRKSHRVTVLWGTVKGNDHGKYLAVYNHTTGDLNKFDSAIDDMAVPPVSTALLIGFIVGVLAICFYALGIVLLAVLMIRRSN